jgi:hypothetical protein
MVKLKGMFTKRIALFVGTALFLVAAGAVAEAATSRSGPITKFDGTDEIVEACTTSTNWVNMPQMTRTFTVGGTTSASVASMFQGSLSLDSSHQFDTGFIRLTIDGNAQSPGTIPAIAPGERGTHGFNWASAALTTGSHTARVQWRTDLGSSLCVDARSLLVLHR